MKKEYLKITMETEVLPENSQFLDFHIRVSQDGWFTRIFKDWKRIKMVRCQVKKLDVIKKETK